MASVRTIKGRLYYDFYFEGVRCIEAARQAATKANLRQAKEFVRLLQAEIDGGVFQYWRYFPHGPKITRFPPPAPEPLDAVPADEELPFNRYFADWMEAKVLKESTRRNWESTFWLYLYPFFRDRPLSSITRMDVRRFQKHLVDKGLAASTINDKPMKILRMMLYQAFLDEFIPKNPALGVRRLAQGLTDVDPFTLEEREALIAGFRQFAPYFVNYVICCFWTGWRPNEANALKWSRVDFFNKKILIREGRVYGKIGIPKTAGSLRDLDMLPPVEQALVDQKAISWLVGREVFLTERQQPVDLEYFRQKVWVPVLKKVGIRYRPPYQIRHTFATHAISVGENVNWVARMLGHKSPVMTLERYNRFVPNLTRTDGRALLATATPHRSSSSEIFANGKF